MFVIVKDRSYGRREDSRTERLILVTTDEDYRLLTAPKSMVNSAAALRR